MAQQEAEQAKIQEEENKRRELLEDEQIDKLIEEKRLQGI